SCGGGPEGKQYVVNWFVNTEGDHLYMEPGEKPVHDHDMHEYAQPHVHIHASVRPRTKAGSAGFFGGIKNWLNRLREKGLGLGGKQKHTKLRPVSAVETGV